MTTTPVSIRLRGPEARIALASFLLLFLELVLIRWLPAYILHLAYFSNFVLLASFFGSGLGFLLCDRRSLFPLFSLSLLVMAAAGCVHLDMSFRSEQELVFQSFAQDRSSVPFWILGPVLFVFVAAVFIGPAQLLGSLFRTLPPLSAYTWNLVGSIAGVAGFALFSVAGVGPMVWFATAAAAYLILHGSSLRKTLTQDGAILVALFLLLHVLTSGTIWSPYYKLVVKPLGDPEAPVGYSLYANESGHQTLQDPNSKEWIYHAPYLLFSHPTYQDVLVIGAGGGTDVALALERGAGRIDAVDIDPTILALGRKLHPLQPYSDPRVHVTVADGRTFLERTPRKYDLIIFALTDSLALASSYSNTRLESYLFTEESFRQARSRLKPNGLLVLYNYYREQWLIDKLGGMLERVFGHAPYIAAPKSYVTLAAIMAGPKLADLVPNQPPTRARPLALVPPSATDEWPFLYMERPAFPRIYVLVILEIAALAAIVVIRVQGASTRLRGFPWQFFFLGAGFLLLETKNVVNFQLLFGSTWSVNALVFLAILGFGLAGVIVRRRTDRIPVAGAYLALLGVLGLNLILPLSDLTALDPALRYAAAALLTLSPVFFSSLIFSEAFASAAQPELCLAANLLGALAGGFSEYAAMLIGYRWLAAVAILYYLASWGLARRSAPGGTALTPAAATPAP